LFLALVTLFHILVFVYWLGGDLGVFYSSTILTDTKTSPQGRIIAAKVLAQVDMAPRTAMILTLPTGLTLASQAGYLSLSAPILVGVWMAGLAWLALAWTIHLKHLPPSSLWRRADLGVRGVLIIGLLGTAISGMVPLFLALKLAILATTIVMGLLIRRALAPFGAAFGEMIATGPTPQIDHIIAKSLNGSRPAVVCIWILLLIAALIGIAKPT
jgi:hypothetical protein